MTYDDYDKMVRSGADVGPVRLAVDSLQSLKDAVFLDYQSLRDCLNSPGEEFFLTYELSYFQDWAHLMQQIYELYLQNFAIETDYLLLSIDSEEEELRFIEAITNNCPQINSRRKNNPKSLEALMDKSSGIINEMEMLANKMSDVIGSAKANLELYRDIAELDTSGGVEEAYRYADAIAADMVDLQGFPLALPYPDWWYLKDNETFMYLWDHAEGEDGEDILTPGDPIETPPDQYLLKWEDVSLEEYLIYVKTLKHYGISAESSSKKDGVYIAFYTFPDASFTLTWEDGEVSLFPMEGAVCLAPCWYVIHTSRSFS